jgi:hypothetical protein
MTLRGLPLLLQAVLGDGTPIERFGAVVAHPILSGYTIDTLESSYAPNAQ